MLEIMDFSKTYRGGKRAVDHLTLTVSAGDIYGFIGQNGAGKTTTIRAVTGVLDFSEGDIAIAGHSVKREPLLCKRITAYVPDNPDLYDYLTGVQYLCFIGDVFGLDKKTREAKCAKYAEMFEMTSALGSLISSYSHGMKQRLALISAFMHDPKLLIFDEPFVGLDPGAVRLVKDLMRKKCEEGCAVFFSTHVLDVAEKLCNKIAILKSGRLVTSGDTDAVRGNESLEDVFLELSEAPEAERS